jgi:hypothetical protein
VSRDCLATAVSADERLTAGFEGYVEVRCEFCRSALDSVDLARLAPVQ